MQENTASVHYRKSWNAQSSLPSALTPLRWTVCKNVSRHNVEMHATPPWQRQHNQWSQLGGSRCERGGPSGAISPRFTPCTLHQTRGFFSFYSFVLHFICFFDTYDSVTVMMRAHFRELTPCPSLIWSKRSKTYDLFNGILYLEMASTLQRWQRAGFSSKVNLLLSLYLAPTQKPGLSLAGWQTHCMGQLLHKQGR